MHKCSLIFTIIFLQSCSSFPVVSIFGFNHSNHHEKQLDAKGILLVNKLNEYSEYTEILSSVGAKDCLPGQIKTIQKALILIRNEAYSGLTEDATIHLNQIGHKIRNLQCMLQAVQKQTGCGIPDEQKLPLQNWYLNINYQACNTEDISEVVSEVPTERILFNFDSSELSHESKSLLDNYVSYLLKYDDINMQISGHTDSRGGHIYNDLLSYQRAKAVSSYIQSKGVKSQRIELEAYGENRLETAEHNDYEMQLNRRVVLTFMGREKDAYFN